MSIKQWVKLMYYRFKYRKMPDGICGCGASVDNHQKWNHAPFDYKEWCIRRAAGL